PTPSPAPPGTDPARRCEVQRVLSSDLAGATGRRVRLAGWVHRRRQLKSVEFLIVRDRAGLAQVVTPPGTLAAYPEESPVHVTGLAAANPAAPAGVEVVDAEIELLAEPAATPPVELFRPTLTASLPTL